VTHGNSNIKKKSQPLIRENDDGLSYGRNSDKLIPNTEHGC